MKILLCHNHYQEPGGEDQSFAAEAWLLESHGHEVVRFIRHNDDIKTMARWDVARRTIWSTDTYRALRGLIRRERPDVMHCTNTFPLISPAAYYAARAEHVPVVQSLRNYRQLCLNSFLLREGKVCEDCLGRSIPWPGIIHRCYRDSAAGSAVVAAMLAAHRAAGTWTRAVDMFFAVSEFARNKFVAEGWPANRIAVKPNFVHPDPGVGDGAGRYVVFVGRLSPEKGIDTLLAAWERLAGPVGLKIVGDGPLADLVASAARRDSRIEWLGRRSPQEVLAIVGRAACLVMPSIWYETFGRVIVEGFAKGTPAVVSRLGAMAELVDEGRTGLLFEPGNAGNLALRIEQLFAVPATLARMRRAARAEYEARYTAEPNYQILMRIYEQARALKGEPRGEGAANQPPQGRMAS